MIRRPPRATQSRSSAASDVYKRQFTYNEPTIWGEYVIDICDAAREAGINTVMVTNGYVTREAFHDIYDHVDAANVDLKAFTEEFYGRMTLTHLQPVLDTLTWLKQE